MRPKKTFRATDESGRAFSKSAAQFGVTCPEDSGLDIGTAASLAIWRGKYQRFFDPAHNPPTADVKATLLALAALPDAEIDEAVRLIDNHTMALLKEAARLEFRRLTPFGPIPPGALTIRQVDPRRQVVTTRDGVQHLALAAAELVPKHKGNPNKVSGLDHLFAVALVTRWNAQNPNNPARVITRDVKNSGDELSEFQNWAWDMFNDVGRRSNRDGSKSLSEASLARILDGAIKDVQKRS